MTVVVVVADAAAVAVVVAVAVWTDESFDLGENGNNWPFQCHSFDDLIGTR